MKASEQPLYKDWAGGEVEGLLIKGGLFDSSPLNSFIKDQFKDVQIQRDITVGLVDVLSGDYVDFTKENLTSANIDSVMYASFSVPAYFAPVEAFGTSWFDGSAIWDLDVASVIN